MAIGPSRANLSDSDDDPPSPQPAPRPQRGFDFRPPPDESTENYYESDDEPASPSTRPAPPSTRPAQVAGAKGRVHVDQKYSHKPVPQPARTTSPLRPGSRWTQQELTALQTHIGTLHRSLTPQCIVQESCMWNTLSH